MKPNKLILAALCVACLHSCEQPTGVLQTSTGVSIQYPDQLESVEVVEESLVFTNAATGEETTAPVRERFSLPQGLYNCVYTATITYRTTSEGATSQPEEGEAGDLIVTYRVHLPEHLTERQKELLREMRDMQ